MAIIRDSGAPMAQESPDMTLRDRALRWRDSILANPGFQRFAGAFPLTRPVARRRAGALFDLCAGFVYSQILFAGVKLRLFEKLAEGPQSAAELAPRLSLPVDRTELLLDAAVSLRLAQTRSRGRYGLGPLGAALLGNPGVAAMIEHHAMLYGDLADPVALLRGDSEARLPGYWPYVHAERPEELTREAVSPYTALMAVSQPMVGREVVRAYSFRKHRCLLDVGGGDGSFLSIVAAHAPDLRLVLFDLPAVADKASERFRAGGLSSRAVAIGGSFLTDRLPEGADIVSLVRIVHDHDDEAVMTLLRAVRCTLPENGTLLIAEPMSGIPGSEPIGDAYFAFYLMAMGSGRPRTAARLRDMLCEANFRDAKIIETAVPLVTSLMVARAIQ